VGSYVFDTSDYTNVYDDYNGDCGSSRSGAGPEMVFVITVNAGETLDVDMDGVAYWDEALVLATDCADIIGSCAAYSDPGSASWENTTGAAVDVYILADGYFSSSSGEFTLDVSIS